MGELNFSNVKDLKILVGNEWKSINELKIGDTVIWTRPSSTP